MSITRFLLIFGYPILGSLQASNWDPSTNHHWGDWMNWTGELVPGDPLDIPAEFPLTIPSIGLDVLMRKGAAPLDVYLSNILLHNGYTILPYSGGGHISAAGTGSLTIAVDSLAHPEIQTEMGFDSSQSLDISIASGSSLNLSGTTELTNSTLTQTGSGDLVITGSVQNVSSAFSSLTMDIEAENIRIESAGEINCTNTNMTDHNSDAIIEISNSHLSILGSGLLTCTNENPFDSDATVRIIDSRLSVQDSGKINCTAGTVFSQGNASIEISNSDLSISSSGLLTSNTSNDGFSGDAILQIDHSTVTIDDHGKIAMVNNGVAGSAIMTFQDSTIDLISGSLMSIAHQGSGGFEINARTHFNHSALNVESGSISCGSFYGDALISFDQGSLSCQDLVTFECNSRDQSARFIGSESQLFMKSGAISLTGVATSFQIYDSTLDLGSVNITQTTDTGNGSAILDIQNSNIDISSGSINISPTFADGSVTLDIQNSNIDISSGSINISPTFADGSVTLDIQNSNIDISSGSINISSTIESTGTGSFNGNIVGSEISLASGDLNISSTGYTFDTNLDIEDSSFTIGSGNLNVNIGFSDVGNVNLDIRGSSFTIGAGNIEASAAQIGLGGIVQLDILGSSIAIKSGDLISLQNSQESCQALLDIDTSSVYLYSGNIECVNTGLNTNPASLSINRSDVILGSGGILAESAVDASTLSIIDSTVRLTGLGTMSNPGNVNSTFTISGSSVSLFGRSGITASHSLDIFGSQIENNGVVQCQNGSIQIQDQSGFSNFGILTNLTGDILLSASSLFTSGEVFAKTSYTQTSDSSLEISITSNQNHGVVLADNLILGGSLQVRFYQPSLTPQSEIPIMISSTDFASRFSSHSFIDTPSYLAPYLIYTPNEVLVIATLSPVNTKAVVFNAIAVMEQNLRLQRQMTHLHMRLKDDMGTSSLLVLSEKESALVADNEMIPMSCLNRANFAQQKTSEQIVERKEKLPNKSFSIYIGPIGSVGHVNGSHGQLGNSFGSTGLLGGFDYALATHSCLSVGLGSSCSYLHNHSSIQNHAGKFNIDYVHGNVYAIFVPQSLSNISVNAAVGGGYEWVNSHRNTGIKGSSLTAKGKTSGPEYDALLGLEYTFTKDLTLQNPKGLQLIFPIFNLQYAHTSLDHYTETGAGIFNLSVNEQKWSALWSLMGIRANYLFSPSQNVRLRPEFSLGWQRQWNHGNPSLTYTTFAAPFPQVFPTSVKGPNKNSLIFGFDLNCEFYDSMFIEFDYDLIYNSLFVDNTFYLQYEYIF